MKIKKLIKYSLVAVLFLSLILFLKTSSFANGGDQRVLESKYLINLSRSPFTPKAGEKTAFIASFVDIQTDKIINEGLIVKVRIAKVGGENGRSFIFEQDNVQVKGGILEFPYTFQDAGLHEIFFDFAFASNPQKVYNAPDFLLDIQKANIQKTPSLTLYFGIALGVIVGFIGGWLIKKAYYS